MAFDWLQKRFSRRRAQLRRAEEDNTLTVGASTLWARSEGPRDRWPSDRGQMLADALEAWRVNPLARRMVGLTTQYVTGSGIQVRCAHAATQEFLRFFWEHPLNRMAVRTAEWCDELTRTGNLFVLVSSDAAGMSYVRAVPADQIERIQSAENDVEQELAFWPRPTLDQPDPQPWMGRGADQAAVMLQYAINRPAGAQWGESDLGPVLRWLSRYGNWLEDRARLNRFRNALLYVVRTRFSQPLERSARQQALNANPPGAGAILVTDENEEWSVLAPKLESADANTDGLALKKMIAAGAGLPLHFVAEPESSTRTTAEAAGGPTYRHFEQRQRFFLWMLGDVLRFVVGRRAAVDRQLDPGAEIQVLGSDISARDNVSLGLAAVNALNALCELRDRQLIDDAELLRLTYKFAGESVDVEQMLARGRSAGGGPGSRPTPARKPVPALDLENGETKT